MLLSHVLQRFTFTCIITLMMTGSALGESQLTPDMELDQNAIQHFHQGQMWFTVGQYEAAIQEFQIGIRLKPTTTMTATLYNNMGLAYLKIHDFGKAIISFQRALALNPNFSLFYENLAKAYIQSGGSHTASDKLQEALGINPEDVKAWYLLGCLHKAQNNHEAAREAFETYLTLAPKTELADAAKIYVQHLKSSQSTRP